MSSAAIWERLDDLFSSFLELLLKLGIFARFFCLFFVEYLSVRPSCIKRHFERIFQCFFFSFYFLIKLQVKGILSLIALTMFTCSPVGSEWSIKIPGGGSSWCATCGRQSSECSWLKKTESQRWNQEEERACKEYGGGNRTVHFANICLYNHISETFSKLNLYTVRVICTTEFLITWTVIFLNP